MSRLLIVDDEERIRVILKKYAEFEGYDTDEAADGMEAVLKVRANDYDLIIMDVMMPELDGFTACREIFKIKQIPVIMLSARGEEYDKIHGFELGIDDYVVKPFSPRELMMRVKAVLGRRGNPAADQGEDGKEIYRIDGLVIDCTARTVMVDGERVNMTPKEYDLLFYMIRNRGIALSREKLITEVWGYDYYGSAVLFYLIIEAVICRTVRNIYVAFGHKIGTVYTFAF